MYILYTNSSYIICTSKTWSSNIDFYSNSNYHPPVYDSVHLERKASKKGCGVLIYIKKTQCKLPNNLTISDFYKECLLVEVI